MDGEQAAGALAGGPASGMTKAQRKEAKAFKKLEAEEKKPAQPYRPLSAAEQTEATRYAWTLKRGAALLHAHRHASTD